MVIKRTLSNLNLFVIISPAQIEDTDKRLNWL